MASAPSGRGGGGVASLSRSFVDDTVPLHCTIEAAEVDAHVTYIIRVWRGTSKLAFWSIKRRYSDFDALNAALRPSGLELPLPPKKVFKNKDRLFIAERQKALDRYLQLILENPVLSCQLAVKRFFDEENYSFRFQEEALHHVSMFFRSEATWDVVESLPSIGWRLRKEYFMIKPKDAAKGVRKHVLTYCEPGSNCYLSEKDLTSAVRALSMIQHPYILPTVYSSFDGTGTLIVRPFCSEGSLRDLIYKTKPQIQLIKKYGTPKGTGLSVSDTRKYGRQIVEALKFLSDRGFLYGHVHAGNVLVVGGNCKLTDTENALLGLPHFYQSFLANYKKFRTRESIVVFGFGRLLYEMAVGSILYSAVMTDLPSTCASSHEFRPILNTMLVDSALKAGMPTLEQLCSHSFFADLPPAAAGQVQLKMGSKLKEALSRAKAEEEAQLLELSRKIGHTQKIDQERSKKMSVEEKEKRLKNRRKSAKEKASAAPTPATSSTPAPAPAPASAPAPAAPPPPSAPAAPPPPPPAAAAAPPPSSSNSKRGALLGSITGFSKNNLKKAKTNDRSAPKV
ncbi:PX domain-containing protein kinase-like protein [Oscarella lobularis]|uniref:PX domain-containing protein kinase-like protein n=1 Tax=Oscarella lobularis TaxID=121494 RepID=UPI0033139AA1